MGETQELGPFVIRLFNVTGNIEQQSYLSVEAKGFHLLKETVISTLSNKATRKKHYVSMVK